MPNVGACNGGKVKRQDKLTHVGTESDVLQLQHWQWLEGSVAMRNCPGLLLKETTAPSCLNGRLSACDATLKEHPQRHSAQGLIRTVEDSKLVFTRNLLFTNEASFASVSV